MVIKFKGLKELEKVVTVAASGDVVIYDNGCVANSDDLKVIARMQNADFTVERLEPNLRGGYKVIFKMV